MAIKRSDSRSQLSPSPVKPKRQVQIGWPTRLTQNADGWQGLGMQASIGKFAEHNQMIRCRKILCNLIAQFSGPQLKGV